MEYIAGQFSGNIADCGGALHYDKRVCRNEQKIRWVSLGNCLIWMLYYAFVGTTAIFGTITVIIALYAYRKKGQ